MQAAEYRSGVPEKVAIATTTLYKPDSDIDSVRMKLAKRTVRKSTELGYAVAVVDGGSPDELLREFERYGAKVFAQAEKGMGPGRRQAIREAHNTGRDVVEWTEPEKYTYVPEMWKPVVPILNGAADMSVPKRKTLRTYQPVQQYSELFGNAFWRELTGYDLDVWFGVRAFSRALTKYFLDYKGEYGDKWDSTFIPVMDAIAEGKRVVSVEVNYVHPKEQTDSETGKIEIYQKRREQLDNLFYALHTHWEKLHKPK